MIYALLLNLLPIIFVVLLFKRSYKNNKFFILDYLKQKPYAGIIGMKNYFPNGIRFYNCRIYLNYFDDSIIVLNSDDSEILFITLTGVIINDSSISFIYNNENYFIVLINCEIIYL